jgi:hypothetical protein
MNNNKKKRLKNKGWVIGDTTEFLNLSPEEVAYVEMIKSSQSRVAKMESGDPSVSLDLLIRSLLTLGASRKSLSRMMA